MWLNIGQEVPFSGFRDNGGDTCKLYPALTFDLKPYYTLGIRP